MDEFSIEKRFKLKPYQSEFVRSKARYPALVSSWSTGKTLCGILKMLKACQDYPNNLFYCVRKEWEDLRDSTVKDFERYTNIIVPSSREVKLENGSVIMFRHMEEVRNLQNINLGGAWIEQAEELETQSEWEMLWGRIRREGVHQFLMVTANTNGHNWIHKLWKAQKLFNFELYEANTFDNKENCSFQWLESLEQLKVLSPKRYRRFVMNSWEDEDTDDVIIRAEWVRQACERHIGSEGQVKRIVGVDVARKGSDKTVMYALENGKILDKLELEKRDTMETTGHCLLFAEKNKGIRSFAVDELNVGAGVVDRLRELGMKVIAVNSSERASNSQRFRNVRAEIWAMGAELFEQGRVQLPEGDKDLIDQLSWVKWKSVESSGILQVESKDNIRERYGRSPDNAEAYLYGLWGMRQILPVYAGMEMLETGYGESRNINGWKDGSYAPIPPTATQGIPEIVYA